MQQSRRAEAIGAILDRLEEFVDPDQQRSGQGTGEHLPLMPETYSASVRELERLLARMREEKRLLWWQVTERYIRCRRKNADVTVRRKGKNGKTAAVVERQVVTVFDPKVDPLLVRRGLDWLAEEWSLGHEPMLPRLAMVA